MGQVAWGGVAAVAGLYAAFLGVGWLAARKVKGGTAADLIVAGRSMPLWVATLTMTATWVDGGYLNGTAEGVFRGSLAKAFQPGFCFGLSLILGGMVFARTMRRLEFTTLIDPFERRYGKRWAAVLFLPAVLGEVFWSAELLVALGSTFGLMLGLPLGVAVVASAAVVTFYTMLGGMWSVAYTDVVQLGLIPLGLLTALPFALSACGGFEACWRTFAAANPGGASLFPPLTGDGHWSPQQVVGWWDLTFMLVLGGVPWNCYFQRVLSCKTPNAAAWHSVLAGGLTILLTAPPLLLGLAAAAYFGPGAIEPTEALPRVLLDLAPPFVGILGLAAIVGAVTSSFSSSVLSAGSMFSWNVYRPLLAPALAPARMALVIRAAVVLLGASAAAMALNVRSVLYLWIFTSDLVFVLLFPQLLWALFDPKANRIGSVTAFVVSLALRLGGGEPLFELPALLPYPELLADLLPGLPASWYDGAAMLFPFRTLAALAGLVLLPLVSRLTARWDPPRPLRAAGERAVGC